MKLNKEDLTTSRIADEPKIDKLISRSSSTKLHSSASRTSKSILGTRLRTSQAAVKPIPVWVDQKEVRCEMLKWMQMRMRNRLLLRGSTPLISIHRILKTHEVSSKQPLRLEVHSTQVYQSFIVLIAASMTRNHTQAKKIHQ